MEKVARQVGKPQPGFFKVRLAKGGAWVPARIRRVCRCTVCGGPGNAAHDWLPTCDRFPRDLVCEVDGQEWPAKMDSVWSYGREIDEADYRLMLEQAEWDRQYRPDAPAANPTEAVDLSKLDPIF